MAREIIRIVLVDDVELVRHTLRMVLSVHPCFAIVGEAGDGEEALACVQRCDPSVVVMDIQMPRLNGIQATALIKRFFPNVIVVGLSVHATEGLHNFAVWRRYLAEVAPLLFRKEEKPK